MLEPIRRMKGHASKSPQKGQTVKSFNKPVASQQRQRKPQPAV